MATEKRVRLLQEHKHGGQKYAAGSVLLMNARVADWLIAQGVATTSASEINSRVAAPTARGGCIPCGRRRV